MARGRGRPSRGGGGRSGRKRRHDEEEVVVTDLTGVAASEDQAAESQTCLIYIEVAKESRQLELEQPQRDLRAL
ncbi:hypothetical protein AB1Y20_015729 [Prymnesium parvum]|uniref:Uncharacterized protein n=1 Tax=Prymnesium parvum TaxID=97485 RepID=A0AB34JXY5_PRYPA